MPVSSPFFQPRLYTEGKTVPRDRDDDSPEKRGGPTASTAPLRQVHTLVALRQGARRVKRRGDWEKMGGRREGGGAAACDVRRGWGGGSFAPAFVRS